MHTETNKVSIGYKTEYVRERVNECVSIGRNEYIYLWIYEELNILKFWTHEIAYTWILNISIYDIINESVNQSNNQSINHFFVLSHSW